MKLFGIIALLIFVLGNALGQNIVTGKLVEYSTPVGSSDVQPGRIWAYKAKWDWLQINAVRDSPKFGKWFPYGTIEESFERDQNGDWIHKQITRRPDGEVTDQTRRLDGNTLETLSLRISTEGGAQRITNLDFTLSLNGYQGKVKFRKEAPKTASHTVRVPVFSGWIAGVVIRSLPLKIGYRASLPAAVLQSKTNYKLWIEVVGQDVVSIPDGKKVDVWVVETGWLDLKDGDIYRQGKAGKGGVFHITKNKDPKLPIVINYLSSQTKITVTSSSISGEV